MRRSKRTIPKQAVHVPDNCDLDEAERVYVSLLEVFQQVERQRSELIERLAALAAKIVVLKAIRAVSPEVEKVK